jgi:hypothetical protein
MALKCNPAIFAYQQIEQQESSLLLIFIKCKYSETLSASHNTPKNITFIQPRDVKLNQHPHNTVIFSTVEIFCKSKNILKGKITKKYYCSCRNVRAQPYCYAVSRICVFYFVKKSVKNVLHERRKRTLALSC